MITTVAAVCGVLISASGLALAYVGYRAWHRQILGKAEHDAARAVLVAARNLGREIRRLRTGIRRTSGVVDPTAPLNERARQALLALQHGGLARLAKRVEALRDAEFDASTLWKSEAECALSPMFDVAGALFSAVRQFAAVHGVVSGQSIEPDPAPARSAWGILANQAGLLAAHDEFDAKVKAALRQVMEYFGPKARFEPIGLVPRRRRPSSGRVYSRRSPVAQRDDRP